MTERRVVVIGAGVGGLAVAIRRACAGDVVTVVERNDVVGGKVATLERDGFTFDLGPSLLTLPGVLDDLFRLAGTSLADEVDLVRLDPQFVYRWPDGSQLVVPDCDASMATALGDFSPGSDLEWSAFMERAHQIWEVSERTFLAGPMTSPMDLLRRGALRDLWRIDARRSLDQAAAVDFSDPRLRQLVGRYATYSGSSPLRAPATLACIAHVERQHGCWYMTGGLGRLRDALGRVAQRVGVDVRTGADVTAVLHAADRVVGVGLADGTRVGADVVVANVDAEHLYGQLLPRRRTHRRVRRAKRSTSGFVLCAGVDGRTPGIAHHNVWFSGDGDAEFEQLAAGRVPDDPTIYGCVSSVTDPTQAPDGCENWYLLVNTPPGIELDRAARSTWLVQRLAERGVDLSGRMRFVDTMTPADIAARFRAPGGAIYGTSSDGPRAAFLRPSNVGPIGGLYLVGGSSHPGGGLPLVTISARIVSDLIAGRESV